ncbi:uncharacterized protein LOC119642194 isoform X1 [Glossina fuscipes]|uniref:Uncharacterized protein LOC119642194 isoform X1 n=1 Tax=Glossina fuscipes TaxID=7396 RepID=A0A9C5ZJJ3_9MUSC|nr:uncharacterized protein LOC119642194 isoform X1 [Glossina fuscipes]KAI9576638.1 hypothetical protein GQX74_010620 [Glossina fuscipes]
MEEEIPNDTSPAQVDAQLIATLCEIDKCNYLYLFERCKQFNVNARQLRYFEKDHVRELIPKTQLGIRAEFEFLLKAWKTRNGSFNPTENHKEACSSCSSKHTQTKVQHMGSRLSNEDNLELQKICNSDSSNVITDHQDLLTFSTYAEDHLSFSTCNPGSAVESGNMNVKVDVESFPLTTIIPTVLRCCEKNYKNAKLLTEEDRRLMARSIIDYFDSRNIRLQPQIMNNLAEQITQYFPTENKKAWYDRHRGRLQARRYTARQRVGSYRKKRRITAIKTLRKKEHSKDSTLQEDIEAMEQDEGGQRIQNWLKCYKCEDFNEVMDMWDDTLNYRNLQIKYLKANDLESVREFLDSWPSYKLPSGYKLFAMDFEQIYPITMSTYKHRWLIFKEKVVHLMETEIKDSTCVDLLKLYKVEKGNLNDDSIACTLIHLLHAMTKPVRSWKSKNGNHRYSAADSQRSVTRLINDPSECFVYNEPYPCIFVMGESFLEIRECYIVFQSLKYKLSFEDALATAIHLYALFKLDDPLPSVYFWQFIRSYFFDIKKNDETSHKTIEVVVKYLKTADTKLC